MSATRVGATDWVSPPPPAADPVAVATVPAGPGWAGRWRLSVAGLVLVEIAVAGYLALRTRHEWFFVDEWDFLARRVGPHPPAGLLIPHNEHPSMLPILVWRALYDIFGIQRYSPYMAVVIACHLAVVVMVWALGRRCGAGPGVCLVVATVMATAGVGWENMIWAFQIGMLGSLLASWGGAVLTDRPAQRWGGGRLAVTWLVLTAGLACSAVSVPLLVLPFLVAAGRRGLRAAMVVVGVPALLFLAWYVGWGRHAVRQGRGLQPSQLAGYVIEGMSSALDGLTGIIGTSAVVLVIVFVGLRSGVIGRYRELTATAGLVGIPALYAFISLGRASLGDVQAQASRYAYLAAALVLPAAGVGLQRFLDGARRQRTTRLMWIPVVACTVALGGRGIGLLADNIDSRTAQARTTRTQAAAGNALVAAESPMLVGAAPDKFTRYLDGAGFIRLHRLGAFAGLPVPTQTALATSRLAFETRLSPRISRTAFDRMDTPILARPVGEYPTTGQALDVDATRVVPQPFTGTPTVVRGTRTAVPADIPAALGCFSAAPTDRAAIVQLTVGPGTRAVLILVGDAGPVAYGWATRGTPLSSVSTVVTPEDVEQLTIAAGIGIIQIRAEQTLTLCPVR